MQVTPPDLASLILWLLPGLSPSRLQRLRAQTQLNDAALLQALPDLPGLRDELRQMARLALDHPQRLPFYATLQAHLEWQDRGGVLLDFAQYPRVLQHLSDPPKLLCVQGDPQLLFDPSVALVGSRLPSAEGQRNAREWAHWLAWQGVGVVSGLARGVDAAAHRGCLAAQKAGASGGALAFVAQGLDRVYPPEHADLMQQMTQQGAVISEYPLGTAPLGRHFPARNRLITGVSLGVVVVEARLKSGSMVSARLAMDQGREVMAIPGSIRHQESEGCHALIRQGTQLVSHPLQVLESLYLPLKHQLQATSDEALVMESASTCDHLSQDEKQLIQQLGSAPVDLDALHQQLEWPVADLLVHLQALELKGMIENQLGGWVRQA